MKRNKLGSPPSSHSCRPSLPAYAHTHHATIGGKTEDWRRPKSERLRSPCSTTHIYYGWSGGNINLIRTRIACIATCQVVSESCYLQHIPALLPSAYLTKYLDWRDHIHHIVVQAEIELARPTNNTFPPHGTGFLATLRPAFDIYTLAACTWRATVCLDKLDTFT